MTTPDQTPLLDIGPPGRCRICGSKLKAPAKRPRCRWCDKGDIPKPGTPAWHRWTRGICRTIRARLEAAGLWRFDFEAVNALVFDTGECPAQVAPLLADIAALPCSYGRYNVVLERALNEVGLSMKLPRPRLELRVEAPRVRIAAVEEEPVEPEAEREAAAVEEARAG